MKLNPLGQTGLSVNAIGFGALHFDDQDDETLIGHLLQGVLDRKRAVNLHPMQANKRLRRLLFWQQRGRGKWRMELKGAK
jgi:aryl-alcohol dehydrogenase-like predicted oxidoreductase